MADEAIRVIAIDPGVESGYAYAKVEDGRVKFFPFQMVDDVDDLFLRLKKFFPRYIVMEDFEFRGGAARGLNLFPVQLIGVARLYEMSGVGGQCAIYMQKASQGKGYYSDAILKARKIYKRGIPHGMDATRHLMQWLTFGAGHQFIGKNNDFATMLDVWGD